MGSGHWLTWCWRICGARCALSPRTAGPSSIRHSGWRGISRDPLSFGAAEWMESDSIGGDVKALLPRGSMR
jgi:hypothetical protein